MKKEIIIICAILIIITLANFCVVKYLENSSNILVEKIEKLSKNIKEEIKYDGEDEISESLNIDENIIDNNKIDQDDSNIGDDENELMNDLYDEWKRTSEIWSTIVIHQELDQIEQAILRAKVEVETDELDEALVELEQLAFILKHIPEKEMFMLKNIL